MESSSSVDKLLSELGQEHIIKEISNKSQEEKDALAKQINFLNTTYPGGIKEYISRAKQLLHESKHGINPYADYKPSVPEGEKIDVESSNFESLEDLGLEQIMYTSFVLVAGGLGERLGYNGIKIGLPANSVVPEMTFLEYYVRNILAFEDRCKDKIKDEAERESFMVPLCIMTSGDTYKLTMELLEEKKYFNTKKNQITIIKQEKVPAIIDNDCRFVLDKDGLLETKPHGHGDIHCLLYQKGIVEDWLNKGKKWTVFFQDTNALIFKCIPSFVGVSHKYDFVMNTITVPRKPGEAMGAICTLTNEKEGRSLTINVEYNQLDSLLKSSFNKDGDVPDANGQSLFPGNTNVLAFKLVPYFDALKKSQGLIPEFVNPKYADSEKNKFKSSTRLECMMQDFPKLLPTDAKVGFTRYDRWVCYSSVKNNIIDAAAKFKGGLPSESASSAEKDIYFANSKFLKLAGVNIAEPSENPVSYGGIEILFGAKIFWYPDFAATLKELKSKFSGTNKISSRSTVVFKGRNTFIKDLDVDDSVFIENTENEHKVFGGTYKDAKYLLTFEPITNNEENTEEKWAIRGYKPKSSGFINLKPVQ